jgi:hypothetical protein
MKLVAKRTPRYQREYPVHHDPLEEAEVENLVIHQAFRAGVESLLVLTSEENLNETVRRAILKSLVGYKTIEARAREEIDTIAMALRMVEAKMRDLS